MKAIMTEQGLLIPKEELVQWGELVVEEKPYQIIIRPKSITQLTYGIVKGDPKWLEQIIENVGAGEAAKEDKLKRFHELVDKRLDGNLKESEQAELEALELSFDEADAAIMASLERERKEIDSQTLQIGQLKEIGKKLDELLYQFADNVQNQKEA